MLIDITVVVRGFAAADDVAAIAADAAANTPTTTATTPTLKRIEDPSAEDDTNGLRVEEVARRFKARATARRFPCEMPHIPIEPLSREWR
jgi:hypothetical protein